MVAWRRHESNEGSGAVACGSAPFEPFAAREPAAHAQDVVDAPDQVDLIAPQSRGKVLWWGDGLVLDRPCELHGQEGVPEQERASSGGRVRSSAGCARQLRVRPAGRQARSST